MGQRGPVQDKLLQVFFLEQPYMAMGSAKGRIFMLRSFAGKGILSGYCENGQKNGEAENGYNKLILREMCSIRAAGLPHPPLVMFPAITLTLCVTSPDCSSTLGTSIGHRTPQLQLTTTLE